MHNMQHIAGGVVYNLKTDKIAVVNQNNDSWSLPKGHIEAAESPRETALREIWEETGIPSEKLQEVSPLGFYERLKIKKHPGDPDQPRSITLYLYATEHADLAPHDPANPRALWLSTEEVPTYLTHPKDKEFFIHILPTVRQRIENFRNPKPKVVEVPSEDKKAGSSDAIAPNESEDEHGHQHEKVAPRF